MTTTRTRLRLTLSLAALALAGHAAADSATLLKQDRLRAAPYLEAATGATVPARARVEIVDTRGAWVRIRGAAGEGWVRAAAVSRDAAAAPAIAALAAASGRQDVTVPTATLGIRGVPGSGTAHAVIMSISRYQGGIPPLPGVKHDAAKAAAIAQSMGVRAENIEYLKDEQVTVAGIDETLDRLHDRIAPGDQVFVYYSGHGGRSVLADPEPRCAESLVSVNGDPYLDTRLERQLKRLSTKAGKIIAFIDACHSGGVTTRSVGKTEFRAKTWSKGDAQACVKPVNVLTRALSGAKPGSGAGNFVYIAAARDNEIALDSETRGGLATSAWGECMAGAAIDRDASGGLSAREVLDCAQTKIEDAVRNSSTVLPHHVTITGNADAVLAFAKSAPEPVAAAPMPTAPTMALAAVPPAASAAAPIPVDSTTPTAPPLAPPVAAEPPKPPPIAAPAPAIVPVAAVAAPPAPAPAVPVAIGASATLTDLFANRDDRRRVEVAVGKPRLRIGRDKLSMTITSTQPGLLYVLMAGSDGKTFDLLFPNQLDRNNAIAAHTAVTLPRAGWDLVAQGPAGRDRLLVIVSDAPRDLKALPLQPAGPFSIVDASPTTAKDIQLVFGGTGSAPAPECKEEPAKRTLAVVRRCSAAYGAALVEVEEIP